MSSSYAQVNAGTKAVRQPFPGLRPFDPNEDHLFFGRERQTDELLRKLRTTRFLSILGTSGSGKSSLVRSGLIPALYGGAMTKAGSRWRVAIMRPGEDPLGNLAEALSDPEALGPEEDDEGLTRAFFDATLRASNLGLIECIRQARVTAGDNVLVLVDQFEELFRYKHSRRQAGRDEALAFVKLLLAARESGVPCYIALTMRSDFIGDCMEFGSLPEVVNEGVYLVPRMTRDELREAITGPVAVGGGTIAPRLVSRLLNDVGDDLDQLPILQHALMRTWDSWMDDHRPGEPLDLRHYEAIGTMRSALSRHAEEAFGDLDARGQQIAEKLFKALTDKGADVRGVRRPAPIREIRALAGASFEEVRSVAETFRKTGRSFVMPPPNVPLDDDSILDISHESLMRVWERLTQWADEEARSAQLYLNVARAAARHEEGSVGLWRDPELQFALNWRKTEQPTEQWAARYDPSFARAMAFLDRSRDERDRELRERERRRRTAIFVLSIASLLLAALGVYAFAQKRVAQTEAARASTARRHAEEALAQVQRERRAALEAKGVAERERATAQTERTNAQVQQAIAEDQKKLAEQQTVLAREQTVKAENERWRANASRELAMMQQQEARAQKTQAENARSQAVVSEQETRRLSRLASARVLALAVLQEGRAQKWESGLLAAEAYRLNAANGGKADDADIFTGLRVAHERFDGNLVLRSGSDAIRAFALSGNGASAIGGGYDGTLYRFDLRTANKPVAAGHASGAVYSMAIRGELLAVGLGNGKVELRDLGKPDQPPRELVVGTRPVTAVAFQPSGALLAAASLDGAVKSWNADRPDAPVTFQESGAGREVRALAFRPDGKRLAVTYPAGVRSWDVADPRGSEQSHCDRADIRSVAFSPDGQTIACGTYSGAVVLWTGKTPALELGRHESSVNSLGFSPDGKSLATAGSDRTVRLWNVKSPGSAPIVLPGHESWVWGVAFSPDGSRLISASEDRTLRTWLARSDVLFADLCGRIEKNAVVSRVKWSSYLPEDLAADMKHPCAAR